MSRELDAEVAEKVMGWRDLGDDGRWVSGVCPTAKAGDVYPTPVGDGINRYAPPFSEEIQFAWDVIGKMRELGWLAAVIQGPSLWEAQFAHSNDDFADVSCEGITAPEAICRAALAALGAKA